MARNSTFHPLTPEELDLLGELRRSPPAKAAKPKPDLTFGQRLADSVTAMVGSWRFILIQTGLLVLWILANVWAWFGGWDPYPFILLNLLLSFQAAYTAPIIMMSQNRQAEQDRRNAESDYRINVKAELEIELLHQKIDLLREQEMMELIKIVRTLEERLLKRDGV
jgi:uncharacterized membrane protein